MRVLVACECSGTVRDAFRFWGIDAWSCDLSEDANASPFHLCLDVREIVGDKWDLMIAHPPCTYLCNSGVGRLIHTPPNPSSGVLYGEARWEAMRSAATFFRMLLGAKIKRVALENPVMHGHASHIIGQKYAQTIQPYNFGDDASKRTALHLKNLPKLKPTKRFYGRIVTWNGKSVERWSNQTDSGQNALTPSQDRGAIRSVTYPGIADAMAEQWGFL